MLSLPPPLPTPGKPKPNTPSPSHIKKQRNLSFKQELLGRGYTDAIVAAVLSRTTVSQTSNATPNPPAHTHETKSDPSTPEDISDLADDDTTVVPYSDSDNDTDSNDGSAISTDEPPLNHLHVAVWLEAVDPHHRYSKSLMKYFRYWQTLSYNESSTATTTTSHLQHTPSTTPSTTAQERVDFFSWLDFGGGCHLDLPWCPRRVLDRRRVKYMNLEERSWFEVIINKEGLFVWKLTGRVLHTPWGILRTLTKGHLPKTGTWIFVLSQQHQLYVGQKVKGRLHHSSFTAGAPTNAAGNIRVHNGKLVGLKPQSGHYRPDPVQWKQAMDLFLLKGGVKNYSHAFPSHMR